MEHSVKEVKHCIAFFYCLLNYKREKKKAGEVDKRNVYSVLEHN